MKKLLFISTLFVFGQTAYAEDKDSSKKMQKPSNDTNSLAPEQLLSHITKLQDRLAQLEAHAHLEKALKADDKETYMPGWLMLAPEKQKRLWYTGRGYLTDEGYIKDKAILDSDMASCSEERVKIEGNPVGSDIGYTCLLKYQIPQAVNISNARGYVINFAALPSKDTNDISIACSGKNGGFINDGTWAGNAFMSYNAHVNTTTLKDVKNNHHWHSHILNCPIVKNDFQQSFIYIQFGSNYKIQEERGSFETLASLIGYW